jgi:hypothetical protein
MDNQMGIRLDLCRRDIIISHLIRAS